MALPTRASARRPGESVPGICRDRHHPQLRPSQRLTGVSDALKPPARTCGAADVGRPRPRHPRHTPEQKGYIHPAKAEPTRGIHSCVGMIYSAADASFRTPTWGVCAECLPTQTPCSTATESSESLNYTGTSSRIATRQSGASDARKPSARTCGAADEGRPSPHQPCRIPKLEVSIDSAEAEPTRSKHT